MEKDIRNIIIENQNNIAFIIGNGIHYQYRDCSISWEELLKDLWNDYVGKNAIFLKELHLQSFMIF